MKTLGLFQEPSDFITIEAGEIIFGQDQITDFMYVLIEGQVAIQRNGVELVTVRTEQSYWGNGDFRKSATLFQCDRKNSLQAYSN